MSDPAANTERELIGYLEKIALDPLVNFSADTEIFGSGVFDSLALVQIVEWVESKTRSELNSAEVDFRTEWATIGRIAAFVDAKNAG